MNAQPKRGMFIFATSSKEEAEAWVKTAPVVQVGLLDYRLDKIYSSAALMMVNEQHKTLT